MEHDELDIEAFSDFLRPAGLAIRDVSNDGNCFFRAVSDQFYGSEDYHMKLRERACDYLLLHQDHYKHFIDEEQSFDQYVNDMRNDGVWADNLELQAISMAYKVNIRVHQSGKPSYDIRNHTALKANAIHLSYHFGEHYASVRPLHTSSLLVPAQHGPLPSPRSNTIASPSNSCPSEPQDLSTRRPHPTQPANQDNLSAVQRRAYRGYLDMYSLVVKTRRAAQAIQNAESTLEDVQQRNSMAKKIENDMNTEMLNLGHVREAIVEGKLAQLVQSHRPIQENDNKSAQPSNEPVPSSLPTSEDKGQEEDTLKDFHRISDSIFASLLKTEKAVCSALELVKSLKQKDDTANAKPSRGCKKKEQELKRKERKERRRKEQERIAQGDEEELSSDKPSISQVVDLANIPFLPPQQ